jgi:hypothetical protein
MRSAVLAALAACILVTANLYRLAPRRDGRFDADCAWHRDSSFLPAAAAVIAEPPRGAARWLRETIGHASIPALVTFRTERSDGRPAARWAAIVPDGGEWAPGAVDARIAVDRVDRPAFVFGIEPADRLPGIRFPSGAAGDLHRSRLGFAWPAGLDEEDFTFSAWVRPAEVRRGEHMVIASRSDAPFYQSNSRLLRWHLYLGDGSGEPALAYAEEGDGHRVASMASQLRIVPGRWTHVALTLSRSPRTIALYVNGALQGRLERAAPAASPYGLGIGTFAGSAGSHPLRGDLVWATFSSPSLGDDVIARMAREPAFAACGGSS